MATINRCFTPSDEDVAHARRVVEPSRPGDAGTIGIDGKMYDIPHLNGRTRACVLGNRERHDPLPAIGDNQEV